MVPSREGGRGEGKPSPLIYEGSRNFDLGSTDLGSSWGAKLGSFSALLAAKMGQDRSKSRFESLSTSKT